MKTEVNKHIAILRVYFSNSYPNDGVVPRFTWLTGTNIDANSTIKILQSINFGAYHKVRQNNICLLHCLKILINCLQQVSQYLHSFLII